jgi:hypothetical protein
MPFGLNTENLPPPGPPAEASVLGVEKGGPVVNTMAVIELGGGGAISHWVEGLEQQCPTSDSLFLTRSVFVLADRVRYSRASRALALRLILFNTSRLGW